MKTFIYLTKLDKEELYRLSSSVKKETEEKIRKEIEEKVRKEIEEKVRKETEDKLRKEMEGKDRREAEQETVRRKEEQQQTEERQAVIKNQAEEHAAGKRKKKAATFSVAAVMCIGVFFIASKVILPSNNYNRAVTLMEQGEYEAAKEGFADLGDFKDSKEKADECDANLRKNVEAGSVINFGSYEQDNDPDNGKEEIEWIVLDKKDDRYLVISKYALDCQPYNEEWTGVTWKKCSLRNWLKETFMESAFDADEKAKIVTTKVTADKNPHYDTDPGKETEDQVFLLSIKEVNKYFSSDEDRMCGTTDYAKAQGAYTSDNYSVGGKATCWWWLRSPGLISDFAAYVNDFGSVSCGGYYVGDDDICVRPALWIDPES